MEPVQTRSIHVSQSPLYRALGDRLFVGAILVLCLLVIGIVLVMGWQLGSAGSEALAAFGFWGFLSGSTWDPVQNIYGAWPFILGTLLTSLGALALAFFPALAVAIFAVEYAPRWLGSALSYALELLASLPSVIYGLWGLFVLVPAVRAVQESVYFWAADYAPFLLPLLGNPIGIGMTSAVLVLAVMIIPFAATLAKDSIALVPAAQREAAYGLGATKWEVIRLAILPYARGGILAGVILALTRALGETMAVVMVIGNSNKLPFTLFGPATTIPSAVINEFGEAQGLQLSSLLALGFILFLISGALNLLAAWIVKRMSVEGRL
ncbi:Phosphate transport system permease protein PstC [Calidithermus terrae]|uniref:Phosphate transport system permease protein n=1 Tax=Calidithermus terrae TaxID=1408545 RepID=A0A399ECK0_9DEIN|nr:MULTISPECIES: phosphate ABC transporter permease subunit PstC [Calidithermus]RIH81233.1 Phosphate transport system permease protein PstC [Calidithermus terrae]